MRRVLPIILLCAALLIACEDDKAIDANYVDPPYHFNAGDACSAQDGTTGIMVESLSGMLECRAYCFFYWQQLHIWNLLLHEFLK